jgi:hypothetical protein
VVKIGIGWPGSRYKGKHKRPGKLVYTRCKDEACAPAAVCLTAMQSIGKDGQSSGKKINSIQDNLIIITTSAISPRVKCFSQKPKASPSSSSASSPRLPHRRRPPFLPKTPRSMISVRAATSHRCNIETEIGPRVFSLFQVRNHGRQRFAESIDRRPIQQQPAGPLLLHLAR